MAKQRTDTEAVINLVINGQQAKTSLKELTDTQRKLNAELRNMKPNDPGYKKQLNELQMINKALDEQKKRIKGVDDESKNLKNTWAQVTKGIIGANTVEQAWAKVTETIGKVVDAYAQAQKNRAVLTNAFNGDADRADKSLKMLMDYAAKTPFSMNEAVEGFIKLVNRGIVPTQQEMVKLGDIAASQGKNLDQLIEAVLDAQTGEFERLKEFGIRASKNGDQVAFSFKGITKEVEFTDEAIKNALLSFGEMPGVANSMKAVSDTIVGLRSNIDDTWDQIFTKIGQGTEGFINGFYKAYAGVLDFINDTVLASESAGQRLTAQYNEQAAAVNNLEKNTVPLINRYDQLQAKGNLNKTEQQELKTIIGQIADVVPLAVTEFDKYGNALGINTKKAREFVDVQRALLKDMNRDRITQLDAEIQSLEKRREVLTRGINSKNTVSAAGRDVVVKEMTNEERARLQKELQNVNKQILERQNALKGYDGSTIDNPITSTQPKNKGRTEDFIKGEIENLEKLRKEYDVHSKEYKKYTLDIEKLQKELADARNTGTKAAISAAKKEQSEAVKTAKKEKEEAQKLKEELLRNSDQIYQNSLSSWAKENAVIDTKYDELRKKAKGNKDVLAEIDKQQEAERGVLNKRITEEAEKEAEDRTKKVIELNKEIFEATASDYEKEYQRILKFYDDLILKAEAAGISVDGLRDAQLNALMALDDKENGKKTPEELLKEEKEREQQKKDFIVNSAQQAADAVFSIWSNNARAQSEANISKLENERNQELSNKNLTEDQKNAINEKFDQKIRTEKKKAWQAEQKAAIAQAIVNGALAVTRAWAEGTLLAPFIIPGIIATTALQVGVIASQKMPEFAKGVRNFEGGTALVGEAGTEIINEKDKWWLTDGPTVANLAPGADVYNATETASMLKNSLYPIQNYSINTTGATEAEKSYRSNSTGANPTNNNNGNDVAILYKAVEALMVAQQQESQKPVVLEYKTFDEYKKKIETAYNIQVG